MFVGLFANIILFSLIHIFVYYFDFKNRQEKNEKIIKLAIFLKWFLLVLLIASLLFGDYFVPYLFTYGNSEQYKNQNRICENSRIIKQDWLILGGSVVITDKGVCARCDKFEGLFPCENENNSWVVKDLNKNNFDYEIIPKSENFPYEKIKFNVKNQEINLVKIKENFLMGYKNVDFVTFQYLGGKYSKDKNHVYYKSEIISADPETFTYQKGTGKTIGKGQDKNGTWIKGILQN